MARKRYKPEEIVGKLRQGALAAEFLQIGARRVCEEQEGEREFRQDADRLTVQLDIEKPRDAVAEEKTDDRERNGPADPGAFKLRGDRAVEKYGKG
jgi:hypothetical protein